MFVVQYDPKRPVEEGQYWVQLTAFPRKDNGESDFDANRCNRLGYYCDEAHLRHIAAAAIRHFNDDLAAFLLRDGNGGRGVNSARTGRAFDAGDLVKYKGITGSWIQGRVVGVGLPFVLVQTETGSHEVYVDNLTMVDPCPKPDRFHE